MRLLSFRPSFGLCAVSCRSILEPPSWTPYGVRLFDSHYHSSSPVYKTSPASITSVLIDTLHPSVPESNVLSKYSITVVVLVHRDMRGLIFITLFVSRMILSRTFVLHTVLCLFFNIFILVYLLLIFYTIFRRGTLENHQNCLNLLNCSQRYALLLLWRASAIVTEAVLTMKTSAFFCHSRSQKARKTGSRSILCFDRKAVLVCPSKRVIYSARDTV